ncbi:MAG: hypothetical protein JNJ61_05430, partial [Anaerolineae bacterium]|nr:hypothetical protein [Anaerolineae bacterium]
MSDEYKDVQPEGIDTTDRRDSVPARFGNTRHIFILGIGVLIWWIVGIFVVPMLLCSNSSPLTYLFNAFTPYRPSIIGTAEIPGTQFELVTVRANAGEALTRQRFSGTVMLRIRDPELRVPPTPEGNRYPTPVTGLSFSYEDFWLDDVR